MDAFGPMPLLMSIVGVVVALLVALAALITAITSSVRRVGAAGSWILFVGAGLGALVSMGSALVFVVPIFAAGELLALGLSGSNALSTLVMALGLALLSPQPKGAS